MSCELGVTAEKELPENGPEASIQENNYFRAGKFREQRRISREAKKIRMI